MKIANIHFKNIAPPSDIEFGYLTPPEIEAETLHVNNNLLLQIELIFSVLMCVTLRLNLLNNNRPMCHDATYVTIDMPSGVLIGNRRSQCCSSEYSRQDIIVKVHSSFWHIIMIEHK